MINLTAIDRLRVRATTRVVLCACVLVSAGEIQAIPTAPDLTISFEVAALDDDVALRLYRSDNGYLSLIAEVDLDAGTSVMRIKDRPPQSESTTYELYWVSKCGREYILGRAVRSASVEPSDDVLTVNQAPDLLGASEGYRVQVVEHRREQTDSRHHGFSAVMAPKPPP